MIAWATVFLIVTCAPPAFSSEPQRPTTPDAILAYNKLRSLTDAMNRVRSSEDEEMKTVAIPIEIRLHLRDSSGKPTVNDPFTPDLVREENRKRLIEGLKSLSDSDQDKYLAWMRHHQRRLSELDDLGTEAIPLALTAFGISPDKISGPIVNGPPPPKSPDDAPSHLGEKASWNPKYALAPGVGLGRDDPRRGFGGLGPPIPI